MMNLKDLTRILPVASTNGEANDPQSNWHNRLWKQAPLDIRYFTVNKSITIHFLLLLLAEQNAEMRHFFYFRCFVIVSTKLYGYTSSAGRVRLLAAQPIVVYL